MTRVLLVLALLVSMSFVIFYINSGINNFDMRFYFGKDDGYVIRILSIFSFSSIFFLLVSRQQRLLQLIKGFFVGIASIVISYFLVLFLLDKIGLNTDLIFHIFACILSVSTFFFLEKQIVN
jgi:hypothetical protein